MSAKGAQRKLVVTSSLQVGATAPIGWTAGISWWADEPLADVLAGLDAALAQLRAQLELDIRGTMR